MNENSIRVRCAPGLETIVARELDKLSLKSTPGGAGELLLHGPMELVPILNRHLGSALRVEIELARFTAKKLPELERKLTRQVPWRDWFSRELPLAIRAKSKKSRIYHSGAIKERALSASKQPLLSEPLEHAGAELRIEAKNDEFALWLDTTGAPLHRRGYRLESTKAPLREDLAFALLELLGDSAKGEPLLDPMCGSGTLAIEHIWRSLGYLPGAHRTFRFQLFKPFSDYRPDAIHKPSTSEVVSYGSDRNRGAIAAAQKNAQRAGVHASLHFAESALKSSPWWKEAKIVACNPPWGHRVSKNKDLRPLYQSLAEKVSTRRFAVASANRKAIASMGVDFAQRHRIGFNGVDVELASTEPSQAVEKGPTLSR